MALEAGTKLGLYEIVAPLGAGGMGEVYRARDSKLGREVAIKVLPEEFTAHPEKLARFEREAKLLAALNHPNVATLYGLDDAAGQQFLVMELVDGETLAERIAKGPLPVDEALPLFVQIAQGLESAHQKGIIHRDLKPANVKITPDGKVKVLDFGLAKAFAADDETPDAMSQSPTLTKGTALGVILGTAAYMSPEQARGKTVDKRTDIWAFGCCLYEALTGRVLFRGRDVTETLASILRDEPNWQALPGAVPARARELLRKCLRKDRARRFHDMADVRIDLEDVEGGEIVETARPKRGRLALIASFVAGLLTSAVVFWTANRGSEELAPGIPDLEMSQLTANPAENTVLSGALSPDAKYLAYTDLSGLTVRLLDTGETYPVPLPSDLVVDEVDWFPDGTTLLIGTSSSALWKTSLFGGSPRKIADRAYQAVIAPSGEGIAYLSTDESPSRQVYVTGAEGQDRELLVEATGGDSFWELAWSPDGSWLLIGNFKRAEVSENTIDAVRVDTKERKVVLTDSRLFQSWRAALPFVWTPDGRLIYARREQPPNELSSNLWSITIDPDATVQGGPSRVTQFTGVNLRNLSLTSDGRRLAFLSESNQSDAYLLDLKDTGREVRRLTTDERDDYPRGWFPDGRAVVFSSNRTGSWNIYRYDLEAGPTLAVSGSDDAELSPNGEQIFYDLEPQPGLRRGWMRSSAAGGPRELVADGGMIQCTPTVGVCILGERDSTAGDYAFFRFDPEEGKGDVVARIEDNPPFVNFDLSLDAARIAVVNNDGRVRIVELETGRERGITDEDWMFGEFVTFAADGENVFLDGSRNGRTAASRKSLLRVSLDPEPKVEELRYRRNVWHVYPEASPDGRYLAFAAMTFTANVWMIEGF